MPADKRSCQVGCSPFLLQELLQQRPYFPEAGRLSGASLVDGLVVVLSTAREELPAECRIASREESLRFAPSHNVEPCDLHALFGIAVSAESWGQVPLTLGEPMYLSVWP